MGIKTIDLFYLHRINEEAPYGQSIEASMKVMAELFLEGKINQVGISECSATQIARAHLSLLKYTHGKIGLAAVQSEYSLMSRQVEENGVLEMCRLYNIGFVAYSPLCRQLLSDDFNSDTLSADDFRRTLPRFNGENLTKNKKIIAKLKNMTKLKNCTVAQLSLAWVLAQGNDIVPIPGTKQVKYIYENTDASRISLTENEIEEMNKIFPYQVSAGARYTKEQIKSLKMYEMNLI